MVWLTETPSQSKIVYGKQGQDLTNEVHKQERGLMSVGITHTIKINEIEPGVTYNYKVLSRCVVKLSPYWPDMGQWVDGPIYSFTTFDRKIHRVTFSAVTDTHENLERINSFMDMLDINNTHFFVHPGDAFDYIESEDQQFKNG